MDTVLAAVNSRTLSEVERYLTTLLETWGATRRLEDFGVGNPGAHSVMVREAVIELRGSKVETGLRSLAHWQKFNEEADKLSERIIQGYAWLSEVEGVLRLRPWDYSEEERKKVQARIPQVKAKIAETWEKINLLEAEEEEAIRDWLRGFEQGRLIVQGRDGNLCCFSIRPIMGAPYPVWNPAQMASALRIGSMLSKDERQKMDFYADPLQFLTAHGKRDPVEKAREAASLPVKSRARAERMTNGGLFGNDAPSEGHTKDAEAKGFGKL